MINENPTYLWKLERISPSFCFMYNTFVFLTPIISVRTLKPGETCTVYNIASHYHLESWVSLAKLQIETRIILTLVLLFSLFIFKLQERQTQSSFLWSGNTHLCSTRWCHVLQWTILNVHFCASGINHATHSISTHRLVSVSSVTSGESISLRISYLITDLSTSSWSLCERNWIILFF